MTRSRADAVPSWVWVPALPAPGAELRLEGDAAHHVARVCRARPGDLVHLTDGSGGVARGEVAGSRDDVRVTIASVERVARARALTLWCGAPEGERADWLVEKLAEFGAATLVLLECERASWARAASRRARWERLATAALGQSRGAWRLRFEGPVGLEAALAAAGEGARWLADPEGEPAAGSLRAPGAGTAAVGPAGGFSRAELARLADAGFAPITLGPTRLRTETAAVAFAAVWGAAHPGL